MKVAEQRTPSCQPMSAHCHGPFLKSSGSCHLNPSIIEDLSKVLDRMKTRQGPKSLQSPSILNVSHGNKAMENAGDCDDGCEIHRSGTFRFVSNVTVINQSVLLNFRTAISNQQLGIISRPKLQM
ncbi:MAG: hypothetical protein ACI9R3_002977 [Verrucomicrobiales bacterium]|jgi:hypothetical protein